jgi:hypothetical protein
MMARWWCLCAVAVLAWLVGGCNSLEDLDQVEAAAGEELRSQASPLCLEYCEMANGICDGPNTLYDGMGECFQECRRFPDQGIMGDPQGNTLQCRLHHLTLAARSDPGTHCPHSGPSGAGTCVGVAPCNEYCGLMLEQCLGDSPFDNPEDCLAACADYPRGGRPGDQTGDNVQCRLTHARLASEGGDRCAHASPVSDVCQ